MLNKQYTSMLQEKDVIFEIFQYATERAKVVGAENIYDFSLGNPSVPAPSIVNETIVQKVNTLDPLALHGYSPSFGIMETREKIAERIGYLAVHPDCIEANKIIEICPQISRTIGQNGAASLMQRTVADVCNYTSDLSVYETNKKILFEALKEYGYHCVEPGGTFYMFPRSLEPDSQAFCKKAMEKDLMLVPGDIFGCPGHFRIAYCVPTERVEKALPIFKELAEEYL